MTELTQARAQLLLQADPASGVLHWRRARGKCAAGSRAGGPHPDGYWRVKVDGRFYLAHRLMWLLVNGSMPKADIDHLNGDRSDNRISNLRDVSRLINLQNQRRPHSRGTSGRLGVTWDRRTGRWLAAIRINGRSKHIGRFDDLDVAAQAYLTAKRELQPGCTI